MHEHGARASQIRSLGYVCVRIPLAPSVVTRDARANVRERREYATRANFGSLVQRVKNAIELWHDLGNNRHNHREREELRNFHSKRRVWGEIIQAKDRRRRRQTRVVLRLVVSMIPLGAPKRRRIRILNRRHHRHATFALEFLNHTHRRHALGFSIRPNCAAILRRRPSPGVVRVEKRLEQRLVRDHVVVKLHSERLGVAITSAHARIRRPLARGVVGADVAHGDRRHACERRKHDFGLPESPERDRRHVLRAARRGASASAHASRARRRRGARRGAR
mmetsp:Transcript_3913/g.12981  ORF Transcript_3913/g.12981 Transcript_3913/m.12981 type:complete len:278 (+) Transcript_3913:104-937(+)